MIRQENERTLVINIAIFKDRQTEAECRARMSSYEDTFTTTGAHGTVELHGSSD